MLPVKCDTIFVEMVANRLAKKFIRHLLLFSKEKNYYVYVACLAEILNWSVEFCSRYHERLANWKSMDDEADVSEKAIMLDGLLLEFGFDRLKKFYIRNAKHTTCLVEKCCAFES